jgi:hypothetical protein
MKKLLVLLLVLGLATPAMAASWEFYGSARMAYFYNSLNEDYVGNDNGDFDLDYTLAGNSRIGANAKVNDAISGRFEYGAAGPNGRVNVRLLYGVYTFGAGNLLVGQDYTPLVTDFSNQVLDWDDNLAAVGAPDDGRVPQIRLTLGNFQVALVQPYTGAEDDDAYEGRDVDVILPKLDLAYQFSTDTLFIMPFLGIQTYDVEDQADDESDTILSYVIGLRTRIIIGPAYVNLSGSYAQNANNFGMSTFYNNTTNTAQLVDGEIKDSREYDLAAVVGFKVSDRLSLEAGVGYTQSEVDQDNDNTARQTTWVWYVNAPFTVAPGFTVTPEVGNYYFGTLENSNAHDSNKGERFYFGAKFQIDF